MMTSSVCHLGETLGSADGRGLLLTIVLQLTTHAPVLRDQLKQLAVWHVSTLATAEDTLVRSQQCVLRI